MWLKTVSFPNRKVALLLIGCVFISHSCSNNKGDLDAFLNDREEDDESVFSVLPDETKSPTDQKGYVEDIESSEGALDGEGGSIVNAPPPTIEDVTSPPQKAPQQGLKTLSQKAPQRVPGTLSRSEMIRAAKTGQYAKVIRSKINSKDLVAKYYKAICFFCAAKDTKLSRRARKRYAQNAENLFKEVGIKSRNKDLKVKSILWHGITLYKHRRGGLEDILYPLRYIQKNYSDTRYANDSHLYTALAYIQSQKPDEAGNALDRLGSSLESDRVYDANYIKWVSPQAAERHYRKLIGLAERGIPTETKEEEQSEKSEPQAEEDDLGILGDLFGGGDEEEKKQTKKKSPEKEESEKKEKEEEEEEEEEEIDLRALFGD